MAWLEELPGENPLLSKNNTAAQLKFAKLHLQKPEDF